uniref:Cyclin dependent kinase inhibitor 1A n=1 Tax=Strigops habroptila TaxID=2489341 RepID=A0A672UW78_STRHB
MPALWRGQWSLSPGPGSGPSLLVCFCSPTTMPLSQSKAGQIPCNSKVCRNLFGPVDHQQLQHDFENLLKQNLEEAQQRWNFDFETETPLEGHFEWERVFLPEELPQEVHSLVKATSSKSRSSLVHRVPSNEHLGRICPEGSQQSSGVYRAGAPQSLKRGQTTIKDFYSSKRRIIPEKPKP